MKYLTVLLTATILIPLYAEDLPRFTLSQVVTTALAKGMENRIIQGNLDAAQAQFAQTQAGTISSPGTALRLSANAGYNASLNAGYATTQGNTTAVVQVPTTVPQSVSGGLTLSGPLTNLSLTETHYLGTDGSGALANSGSLGVTLNQTLWDGYLGGAAKARVDVAGLGYQVTDIQAGTNRLNLVVSIKQAYYTLLSAMENIALFQSTLDQRQQLLKTIQAKYDLQQETFADLKVAQVNVQSAQVDLKGGQNALLVARIRLGNLMGLPETQDFTIQTEPEPESPVSTLQAAFSLALQNRSELKTAELNRRSVEINLDLARGQALPTVSVIGSAALNYDLAVGKTGSLFSAGVKLGMPVLDGGLLQGQEKGSAAQLSVYDSQIAQLRASIVADVREAFSSWQLSLESLAVAKNNEEALGLQKQIAELKFQSGVMNLTDLMTAEVAYTTAQFARTTAKINTELTALQLYEKLGLQE